MLSLAMNTFVSVQSTFSFLAILIFFRPAAIVAMCLKFRLWNQFNTDFCNIGAFFFKHRICWRFYGDCRFWMCWGNRFFVVTVRNGVEHRGQWQQKRQNPDCSISRRDNRPLMKLAYARCNWQCRHVMSDIQELQIVRCDGKNKKSQATLPSQP